MIFPVRCAVLVLLAAAAATGFVAGAGSADGAASPIRPQRLGINSGDLLDDYGIAARAGVGLVRSNATLDMDGKFVLSARAHLRMYPLLVITPRNSTPATDARKMVALITAFARRYGPHGSFWRTHPSLPYLPVQSYEIGNEPNVPTLDGQGASALQYASSAAYAEVYKATRAALRRVDPSGKAVIGGLLDSGGVPLRLSERFVAGLGAQPVDAIGFHPYVYNEAAMKHDTTALRRWLNAHGYAHTPIDVNEFAAAPRLGPSIASWGAQVADYTHWALCTPGLGVETVIPFWWGDTGYATESPSFPWYPMVNPRGQLTPVGRDYLAMARRLTTRGC